MDLNENYPAQWAYFLVQKNFRLRFRVHITLEYRTCVVLYYTTSTIGFQLKGQCHEIDIFIVKIIGACTSITYLILEAVGFLSGIFSPNRDDF